ncbi:LysR family transcriptional regulator [Enterobacter roggenkampii]|uniref:LysR family transcriptional regulator n=1 Tax=Enterobacter roggenkampii TaxID=1812935 RepID=UPI002003308B|nr:LysR family transcriptional regulator [Enterobacter roggenkampii]MCK6930226.1 LysR family transcriptional regulator [Enterobacter roggenkampii]MDL0015036.1 LysR family transcriptional regulator [Enterobacter roggenkampii]
MDKLDALKFFIIASETLNFREAAIKLSVSPSVVTRTVAELEKQLGEPLFKRNTRSIFLTSFGELFLPQAKRLLEDSEKLFQTAKVDNDMKGIVRITLLRFPNHEQILYELLTALRPYPELFIDWRLDMMKLDTIEHRIDIGIRVGREPNPNFIIKNIAQVEHILVASPELIERLGAPTDLEDLRQRYPFSALINPETGKSFEFMSDAVNTFVPRHIEFYTTDPYAEIQAALAGRTVVQSSDFICREYLASGQLVPPLPELRQEKWQFYLYRPYQLITPKRVTVVFSLLEKILRKYFASK